MKKRSRIVSLGVLALTLTMMSTCLMGGDYGAVCDGGYGKCDGCGGGVEF